MWIFLKLKKLNLKKIKKKNKNHKNDTWHNMGLTRVHFFFKLKEILKILIF